LSHPTSRTRYRVAQHWRFRNETPEARDHLVILGVEDHPTQGIICQVYVPYWPEFKLSPNQSIGGCDDWVTQSALDRSVVELVAENGGLPYWFGSTGEFRMGPDSWGRPLAPVAKERTVGELVREQTDRYRRRREELAKPPPSEEPPVESLGLWSLIAREEAGRFRELLQQDPGMADRPLPRDESDDYCYSDELYDECYPLMLAAEMGSVPIAEVLLELGADPARANARGDTALHFASRSSNRDESPAVIARMLCERGADPVARNQAGETPLRHAYGTDLSRVLIEFGAPPTLNHAIRLRMLDWVRRELRENPEAVRAAASPENVLDDLGDLIREEAERRHGREIRLRQGVVPADEEDGWPDRLACSDVMARRLGKAGTAAEDDERREAWRRHAEIERAVFEEYRDLLDAALARGADPGAGSPGAGIALSYAVQMVDTSLAEWLLTHGADPNRYVKEGTARYLTEFARTQAMVDLLHRHGAQDNPNSICSSYLDYPLKEASRGNIESSAGS
jgi:ankyrin repeat protein